MTFEEQLRAWGAEGWQALSARIVRTPGREPGVLIELHPPPGPVTQITVKGNEITFTPRPED